MDCKGCGECCNITNDEYLDVELFDNDCVPIYGIEYRIEGKFYLKRNQDGTCIFLKNKECSIYSIRPTECKEFTQDHPVCKKILDHKLILIANNNK